MVDFVGVPLYGGFWEELADELPDVEFETLELLELLELSEEFPGSSDELSELLSEDASTEVPLFEELVESEISELSEFVFKFEESDPPPLELQPQSAVLNIIAARINEIVLILFFIASPLVFIGAS